MKKLLLILLVNVLLFGCNSENNNKRCKIITGYELVDKFGGDYEALDLQYTYNKYGKINSHCSIEENGNLFMKVLYTYNEKGDLIEELTSYDMGGPEYDIEYKTLYVYEINSNHNSYSESNFYQNTKSTNYLWTLSLKEIIKFNEEGNKYEENYYNSDGSLLSSTLFQYDEYEHIVKGIKRDFESNYEVLYKYEYKDGNRIRTIQTNTDGAFCSFTGSEKLVCADTTIYNFDDNDNLIYREYISANNQVGTTLENYKAYYEYNEHGDKKRETNIYSGGKEEIFIYKTEYCNCEGIENKIYQDPSSNSNPTNNTSNNINTTNSSSSNSYQPKQTETKKSKCYKCNGSGDCRGCTKPQKVRTWSNGWRNNTEVRLGRVVCSTCQGNGRVKESVSGGQYNSGNSCHIGDCISGFRTCRDCSKSNPGKCTKCEGSGYDD